MSPDETSHTATGSPKPTRTSSPPPYVSTSYEAFNPVVPHSVAIEHPPPYPGQHTVGEEDNKSTASSTNDFTWKDICCCWMVLQGTKAAGRT